MSICLEWTKWKIAQKSSLSDSSLVIAFPCLSLTNFSDSCWNLADVTLADEDSYLILFDGPEWAMIISTDDG